MAWRVWILLALSACGPPAAGGTCAGKLAAGDLVITEVFASYKGSGGDTGHEWFELHNTTDHALDLAGVTLANGRPDGTMTKQHTVTKLTIAPGAYATLGDVAPDMLPGFIDYGYADELGALSDTGADAITVACGSTELARALYGTTREGHARELTPGATASDDATMWCDATASAFEPDNDGTPQAASDCVVIPTASCIDDASGAARPIVKPAPGALVITEYMPNPAGTDAYQEWFEITNTSTAAFDLFGLGLDRAGDTRAPDVIATPTCAAVAPGGYALFARSADAAKNGGLPAVDATFSFSLVNGSTAAPGDVQVVDGATVLDAVTWTSAPTAAASQLDPGATSATGNDDPAAFCAATTPYGDGSNAGTPRAANPPCGSAAP